MRESNLSSLYNNLHGLVKIQKAALLSQTHVTLVKDTTLYWSHRRKSYPEKKNKKHFLLDIQHCKHLNVKITIWAWWSYTQDCFPEPAGRSVFSFDYSWSYSPNPTGPLSRTSWAVRDQCSAWTTTTVKAEPNRTAVQDQLSCQGPVFSLDYNYS